MNLLWQVPRFHNDIIKRNIFHVTGLLWGNPPVTGEFPSQRPVTWSFDVFFIWTKGWANKWDASDLRFHHAHYYFTVMFLQKVFQHRGPLLSIISVWNASQTQISQILIYHNLLLSRAVILKFCTENAMLCTHFQNDITEFNVLEEWDFIRFEYFVHFVQISYVCWCIWIHIDFI